jgi:hypothetical protein
MDLKSVLSNRAEVRGRGKKQTNDTMGEDFCFARAGGNQLPYLSMPQASDKRPSSAECALRATVTEKPSQIGIGQHFCPIRPL